MNVESHGDGDEILGRAIAEVQSLRIPATPPAGLLLARVPQGSAACNANARDSRTSGVELRRRRIVHVMVAASAVAAIALGWLLVSPSAPIAIAQVIESTTKHRLVKYKIHRVSEFKDKFKEIYVGNANNYYVVYADLKMPRMRLESPSTKTLNEVAERSSEEILDFGADRYLQIYRFDLRMSEKDTKDGMQRRIIQDILAQAHDKGRTGPHQHTASLWHAPQPDTTAKKPLLKPYTDMGKDQSFLDTLRTLQSNKETVTTKEQVNGRHATKYRLERDGWTSIVWVDASTKLPVRIEYGLVGEATGKQFASISWIYTDFEWDPQVDDIDGLFSTKPPKGYSYEDHQSDK
jgi:hypothetical protein